MILDHIRATVAEGVHVYLVIVELVFQLSHVELVFLVCHLLHPLHSSLDYFHVTGITAPTFGQWLGVVSGVPIHFSFGSVFLLDWSFAQTAFHLISSVIGDLHLQLH
jgi:hypothetical protein